MQSRLLPFPSLVKASHNSKAMTDFLDIFVYIKAKITYNLAL